MKREPVAIINAVVTVISASLPLLIAFGLVNISKEQSGAITSAAIAWGGLIGTVLSRSLVTPVADPKDSNGRSFGQEHAPAGGALLSMAEKAS